MAYSYIGDAGVKSASENASYLLSVRQYLSTGNYTYA